MCWKYEPEFSHGLRHIAAPQVPPKNRTSCIFWMCLHRFPWKLVSRGIYTSNIHFWGQILVWVNFRYVAIYPKIKCNTERKNLEAYVEIVLLIKETPSIFRVATTLTFEWGLLISNFQILNNHNFSRPQIWMLLRCLATSAREGETRHSMRFGVHGGPQWKMRRTLALASLQDSFGRYISQPTSYIYSYFTTNKLYLVSKEISLFTPKR